MRSIGYSIFTGIVYGVIIILMLIIFSGCSTFSEPVKIVKAKKLNKKSTSSLYSKSSRRKQMCLDKYLQEFTIDKSLSLCKYILIRPSK